MSGEHVLICVAWPYANGPLHLGHVAGCYLPPDIHARYERAKGNRVLMVSGSDEHGTPITVTAETLGISPQDVVDKYHATNTQALLDLGCSWEPNIDARGVDYGGSLFNRTSDPEHKKFVQENFKSLLAAGLFEQKTMQQYYEIRENGGRFLPDRYVEGECPNCGEDGARGDQCDECGTTYESHELQNPRSKMNPDADIEIRDTEHFFYRLDRFQSALEQHAAERNTSWKPNVRAMTKQWLDMGLRPRAVTRDLEWGISLPLEGVEWDGKCVYVWFEAVQGYYSCARLWSQRYSDSEDWKKWWCVSQDGVVPRHLYFLGKDNIPFHTVIWPALIMGLNHANNGLGEGDDVRLPGPGDLALETNVPAMEYLMLAGGQFSKSRKHAVWLPSFLERFDPDTLRYYLSINMPESHDTDFNWPDFVEKINSELNGTYGNYVNRIMSLGNKLGGADSTESDPENPLHVYDQLELCKDAMERLEQIYVQINQSLNRHRYKEALRHVMSAAQYGNQMIQKAAPWEAIKNLNDDTSKTQDSLAKLAFGWRLARFLAITSQPFLPFSAQRLWSMLGQDGQVSEVAYESAIDWTTPMTWSAISEPLFSRLDLDSILEHEESLVSTVQSETHDDPGHGVKGTGKKSKVKEEKKMNKAPEGTAFLDFDTFMSVELRTGTITSVEDHPNADKLYVVKIDDGTDSGRTVCAGLKPYYTIEEMTGKLVVFVANLEPRKLRGIVSEGMICAADDGQGAVKLITIDGVIENGSRVR
ncbi:MAG: Methionine--tRNA ligase [Marine Group II euryarchaeote MED-G33]|nr:MAG: Methionine--tRNA ligase [Marine Group II euryarchaeote MED-G33]